MTRKRGNKESGQVVDGEAVSEVNGTVQALVLAARGEGFWSCEFLGSRGKDFWGRAETDLGRGRSFLTKAAASAKLSVLW